MTTTVSASIRNSSLLPAPTACSVSARAAGPYLSGSGPSVSRAVDHSTASD